MKHPASLIMLGITTVLVGLIIATNTAHSDENPFDEDSSKVEPSSLLPLKPTRRITFATTEGTWMSVDVSPDGETIVFDLLGDLYIIPITGGKGKRITSGMAFDMHPRFSPDGKYVAFISDRSGRSAVWIMRLDGSEIRRISPVAPMRLSEYSTPIWTPDGSCIIAQYNQRYGTGKIIQYSTTHDTAVTLVETPPSWSRELYNPALSPDGRFLYFSYSKQTSSDNNLDVGNYQIARLDLKTKDTLYFKPIIGGSVRPVLSHDGQLLVYATRDIDNSTGLRIYNLITGEERGLTRKAQLDAQQLPSFRIALMPGIAFTPDDKFLIMSHTGKIWRVDVATGRQTQIPFELNVELELGPLAKFDYKIDDEWVDIRQVDCPRLSPDGTRLAFITAGSVWLADLKDGKPKRLTDPEQLANLLAWSPDDKMIAYSTWDPSAGKGFLFRVSVDGKKKPEQLANQAALYSDLNYSPDGNRLVFRMGPWPPLRTATNTQSISIDSRDSIAWILADGGKPQRLHIGKFGNSFEGGVAGLFGNLDYFLPHFAGSEHRLYYRLESQLLSVKLDGSDQRLEMIAHDQVLISPRGDRALLTGTSTLHLVTLPFHASDTLNISNCTRHEVMRLHDAGWLPDGKTFYGFQGMTLYKYDLDAFERDTAHYQPLQVKFGFRLPKPRPEGNIVLRGARIITMRGNEILEHGDIVITKNRISEIGPSGKVSIPPAARVVNVRGKTILPGWVDIHAHINGGGAHKNYSSDLVNLAYGVTTVRDPAPWNGMVQTRSYNIELGLKSGPRHFSTGTPGLYNLSFGETEDANAIREHIRLYYGEIWKTETLKQYTDGDRRVRQLIAMAAYESGLMPTNEGMSYSQNLTMVIDGYAGFEHFIGLTPLYNDVIQLLARSGTVWTPTLTVSGDYYPISYLGLLVYNYDWRKDLKYKRFVPSPYLALYVQKIGGGIKLKHRDEYYVPKISDGLAKIIAAGGKVGLGSHGEVQGLSSHFELWSMASGGMPLHDVLRVGTILSADAIGHAKDLGSIEVGKLADLQILDKNPLEDIRNTLSIRYVMRNGFLHEAETLKQIWPKVIPLPRQWWQEEEESQR